MCVVATGWLETICRAVWAASSIGIANAWPLDDGKSKPTEPAVSIPITAPELSTSGPPESPGWMSALVSIRPGELLARPTELVARRDRLVQPGDRAAGARRRAAGSARVADADDAVADGELRGVAELAVVRPVAPWSWRTARSWLGS